MNNTNENTLTENERKFLEKNFMKRATLEEALKMLDEVLIKFLNERAEQFIKRHDVFNKNYDNRKGKNWFQFNLRLKNNGELKNTFVGLKFGMYYDTKYKCGKWVGFYPSVAACVKEKHQDSVKKYFEKNINKDTFHHTTDIDNDGTVWIYIKDDNWWPEGELQNYPKTLDELSQQLNELCEEVMQLMKDYSKKHKPA